MGILISFIPSDLSWPKLVVMYKRTSMVRTLMACSPGLARTIIMVPTGHFRHNPPLMGGTTLG